MSVDFNKLRHTAVLYTCGTCNLNCRYCNIDKNPILVQIDQALAKSFDGDYYFNRLKEYFQDRGQLRNIETWGGEPFLHMERIYPLLHQVINYFPFFDKMSSSTNFSFPTWNDQFFGLMQQFAKYPYRDFSYKLQLSCDGPEYINDAGRGIGTTKKCLDNFQTFLARIGNELPGNVKLEILIKQTLDINTVKLLNTPKKIIEYYKFFEDEFLAKVYELNYNNVTIGPTIPNTAVPAPTTQEDGRTFANFCKLCYGLQVKHEKYFKYYSRVVPYWGNKTCTECLTYERRDYLCGCASLNVGLLPNDMISLCNEGFTQIVEAYKHLAANSKREDIATIMFDKFIGDRNTHLVVTDEEYKTKETQVAYYRNENTSSSVASISTLIVATAMAGQIDKKYLDLKEAARAAIVIRGLAYCIKDNINITGSMTQVPIGLIRLLLNGALEYIWDVGDSNDDKK